MQRWVNKVKIILNKITALIYPKSCLICDQIIHNGDFCTKDWSELQFLHQPACKICFQPFEFQVDDDMICASCVKKRPSYFQNRSIFKYNQASKSLIAKFKYYDQVDLAKYFSILIFKNIKDLLPKIDIIIPVPIHKFRLINRRYNQSALLTKNLGKLSNIIAHPDLLIRIKNNKPQANLSKKLRQRNVLGVFDVNLKYLNRIKNKNILLIDDVITTGATIESCCKALSKSGVNKIYVCTLAKTVDGVVN